MTHSYINPSEKQDLSHLEAGVDEGEIIDPAKNNGYTPLRFAFGNGHLRICLLIVKSSILKQLQKFRPF